MFSIAKTQLARISGVLLFMFVMVLAGCDQNEIQEGPNKKPEQIVTLTSNFSDINSTPASLSTEEPPSPQATPPSTALTPQPDSAELFNPDSARCGNFLPILPDIGHPVNDLGAIAIPEAFVPEAALPALSWLITHPDTVGLAAFEVGRESEGLFLNAEEPMPLASVVKVLDLVAYAEAVEAGQIDPAAWIPLSEIEKTYLPGLDLGSHRRALVELDERGLIAGNPPATPMEEIPWMMIRFSSNAATDFLHLLIGQEKIEETAIALGIASQTAPCPWIGQFLVMSNHQRSGSDTAAVQGFIEEPDKYGLEVMRLTESFVNDPEFRNEALNSRSSRASVQVQSLFSEQLNAQASAQDYARLMAKIMSNELSSSYTNILVRRVLEWPMIFSKNQDLFRVIGYKSGSLPGILTTVYYAERLEDQTQIVVALFYRQLPRSTYRSWRQSLPHDELARWLLSDPEAITKTRNLLGDYSG